MGSCCETFFHLSVSQSARFQFRDTVEKTVFLGRENEPPDDPRQSPVQVKEVMTNVRQVNTDAKQLLRRPERGEDYCEDQFVQVVKNIVVGHDVRAWQCGQVLEACKVFVNLMLPTVDHDMLQECAIYVNEDVMSVTWAE